MCPATRQDLHVLPGPSPTARAAEIVIAADYKTVKMETALDTLRELYARYEEKKASNHDETVDDSVTDGSGEATIKMSPWQTEMFVAIEEAAGPKSQRRTRSVSSFMAEYCVKLADDALGPQIGFDPHRGPTEAPNNSAFVDGSALGKIRKRSPKKYARKSVYTMPGVSHSHRANHHQSTFTTLAGDPALTEPSGNPAAKDVATPEFRKRAPSKFTRKGVLGVFPNKK